MRLSSTVNGHLEAGYRRTSILDRIVAYIRTKREQAQSRTAIEGLLDYDDRMLDDMGLTRQDVQDALLSTGGEQPSAYLARVKRARRLARPMQV